MFVASLRKVNSKGLYFQKIEKIQCFLQVYVKLTVKKICVVRIERQENL